MEELLSALAGLNISLAANEARLDVYDPDHQLTDELLVLIREHKSQLLMLLNNAPESSEDTFIPRAEEKEYYALSPAQSRLYFMYEFDKTSLAYNTPVVLKLEGRVDRDKLQTAFCRLIERHEILRTAFLVVEGEPRQKVSGPIPMQLESYSLESNPEAVIQTFIRPFDLGVAPLIRAGLLEMSGEEWLLMVDMHHIVTDGVSQGILIREFIAILNEENLPDLPLQYKDYAEWRQGEQEQARIAGQKTFWINEFSREPLILDLPADFPRPLVKTDSGSSFEFEISSADMTRLKSIAEKEGATLFMVLFALYNILLGKLTNEEDIVVGVPVAGRQFAELENMIGMFVNSLPIRSCPDGRSRFSVFLASVKTKILACFDNQDYPYEELIDDLKIPRDTSRNPLFDTEFSFENYERPLFRIGEISATPYGKNDKAAQFDIAIRAFENESGIRVSIGYATALFRQTSIERFAQYFQTVIRSVINDPDCTISDINILTEEEENILLFDFNKTDLPLDRNRNFSALFMDQVMKTPAKTAVEHNGSSLSYAALYEKSLEYSANLAAAGIAGNSKVAVYMPRGIGMLTAILAIFQTGAAYVPVDTDYPDERILDILTDSESQLILTTPDAFSRLALLRDQMPLVKEIRSLDNLNLLADLSSAKDPSFAGSPLSAENLPGEKMQEGGHRAGNDCLAYMIYTSGTTGRPKGVMIHQTGMINHLYAKINDLAITGEDIIAQTASPCFDISVWQFLAALLIGGKTYIIDKDKILEPRVLLRELSQGAVTIFESVPSLMHAFLNDMQDGDKDTLQHLRWMVPTGEPLTVSLAGKWYACFPGIRLLNAYGPTEASDDITHHVVERPAAGQLIIPIGRPVQNMRIYILDKHGKSCPRGVKGEIAVSGIGVGMGYWKRESLTRKSFIPNPYVDRSCPDSSRMNADHAIIYKTGDIGYFLENGEIVCLGRVDDQVKIRGFRIEPGEIGNRLSLFEGIQEAAVMVKGEADGKYLVAYYISTQEWESDTLRRFLLAGLPDYMVPAYYVHLDRWPLTANGKLDRQALPEPKVPSGAPLSAPQSSEEKLLVDIWSKVLGIKQIGIMDNFFSIGGDSIKCIQISSRVRSAGYELSVKDIFMSQTIKELAPKLKKITAIADQSVIKGKAYLTPIQQLFWDNPVGGRSHYNQSVMLHFAQGISYERVERIFSKIQEHHDALRMIFTVEGGMGIQENKGSGFPLSLEEYDWKTENDPQAILLAKTDAIQSGTDLENGPLMRLGLFHLKDGSRLLIVIHHLVTDGISWRILLEDIETLYQQIEQKTALSLPLKTDPFLSWPGHLAEYTVSKTSRSARAWWSALSSKKCGWPYRDYPNGGHLIRDDDTERFWLDKTNTAWLLKEAHTRFHTRINDLLLTALLMAAGKTFGEQKVRLDMEGHGREPILEGLNISRTIGWFTSLYPVILEKEGDDLSGMIRGVKESLRRIPNNGIDYLLEVYPMPEDYPIAAGFRNISGSGNIADPPIPANLRFPNRSSILFNYFGQFDADMSGKSFSIATEDKGSDQSPDRGEEYDWQISGMVSGEILRMTLTYSKYQYRKETVSGFMSHYRDSLLEIIRHCTVYDRTGITSADLTFTLLPERILEDLQQKYKIADIYPLSPMQAGMLFHSLAEEDSDSYFEQIGYRLKGSVNIQLVERSLKDLVQRYEILRTIFLHEIYERPLQVVLTEQEINFTCVDLREACSRGNTGEIISSCLIRDRSEKFNLGKGPLLKLTVIQIADDEFEFIWSYHHILMDGWCMGIINREFMALYATHQAGREINLSPALNYSRYIQWIEDRGKLQSADYWKNYLKGFETASVLPALPGKEPFQLASKRLILERDQVKKLHTICGELGVTLYTLIQGAWGILLARYNNSDDIVFGSVVSGRPPEIEGIETMVGLFINTIPVRIQFREQETTREFLKRIQNNALESEPHHYHPLAEVQSGSIPGRDLIDHVMIFENYPVGSEISRPDQQDAQISRPDTQDAEKDRTFEVADVQIFEQTNYPFTLVIFPGEEIRIQFEYNQNAYSGDTIQKLTEHLRQVLGEITADTERPVSHIEIVTAAEKKELLRLLDHTEVEFPRDKTIVDLFKEQVARTPGKIAITCENKSISYEDLDRQSDRLAGLLRSRGVKKDAVVGLLMDRSIETVTGMLSIAKAGGAYLPIDMDYPAERKEYLMKDSCAVLLVSVRRLAAGEDFGVPVVYMEESTEADGETLVPAQRIDPADLCYVIYTSGTTGNPKGVMVEHRNVVRLFFNSGFQFDFGPEDVWTMFHSHCFDFSVWEIYGALLFGGRLIIIPRMVAIDTPAFLKILRDEKVTILNQTPSAFYNLMQEEEGGTGATLSLRYIIFGGEALSPRKLKSWRAAYPNARLINMFGITETTVHVTYKEIGDYEIENNISNIGQPIPTLSVYILDRYGNLTPAGIAGELYVGGAGVSRGYLGRKELTGKKFVLNPYKPQERLYRSGDLARMLDNGDLEYFGRIDDQVQLRGFRVELGEIESQLAAHEQIREAIVVARGEEGEKHLIAYYLSEQPIESHLLRSFLLRRLPDYMIPSYFIRMEHFPLTSNGKINKKALPDPSPAPDSEGRPPKNETEKKILYIWQEVLGRKAIALDEDFFLAGGNSIILIKLFKLLNDQFPDMVKVRNLFEYNTIETLAEFITVQQSGSREPDKKIKLKLEF